MSLIKTQTIIKSDINICFDLALNVDFHQESLKCCDEIAIGGTTYGVIKLGETVTWESTHFGVAQHFTSKVTELVASSYFVDEMVVGAFKSFKHEHRFKWLSLNKEYVLMEDDFYYELPFGLIGKLVNALFLKKYITKLIKMKNQRLKEKAEFLALEIDLKTAS